MRNHRLHHQGLFYLICVLLLTGILPALAGGPLPATASTAPLTSTAGMAPAHKPGLFEDDPTNVAIFRAINDHHYPVLDTCMRFIDTLGIPLKWLKHVDLGIGWTLLPIFILTFRYRRHMFYSLLLGLAIETLLVIISKQFTHQPRPCILLPHVHEVMHLTSNSFPSGHTAMVTVIAGIMAFREKWWLRAWWVLFVLIVAYQRMYTGVHFPLDVLAGLAIGVVSALLTLLVMKRKILGATPATPSLKETTSLS